MDMEKERAKNEWQHHTKIYQTQLKNIPLKFRHLLQIGTSKKQKLSVIWNLKNLNFNKINIFLTIIEYIDTLTHRRDTHTHSLTHWRKDVKCYKYLEKMRDGTLSEYKLIEWQKK